MKKLAVLLVLMFSCTDDDRTRSTLRAEGYRNITLTGYSWNSCGRGDDYCTGFDATSPGNVRVHGAVGCGVGCAKGCTVRLLGDE